MTAFADEIIAARSEIEGVSPDAWYDRLEAEHDRLQADLARLSKRDIERGLRLVGVVWPYWVARGHLDEGRMWLTEPLARTPSEPRTSDRTKALYGAGILAFLQGDACDAQQLLTQSLGAATEIGERTLEADALIGLARVAIVRLVDPLGEPLRNKGDDDGHEVVGALVLDGVHVAALIHEAVSSLNHVGKAGGIVDQIERRWGEDPLDSLDFRTRFERVF